MSQTTSQSSADGTRFLHHAATVALVALSTLLLSACTAKPTADPRTQALLVRTTLVHDADAATRAFTGVVAARVESDLGFRVPGKLLERFVDTGQPVLKGQRLARIDPIDLNLAAHAQQEAVAAARALARQTAADEVRYRNLRERGLISASSHDGAKAAADAAAAQLRAVEAQAAVARNASNYALLVADADGVVMNTLVEPGQVVGAGQVVVRLAHAGPREAVVQLPETLRPALGSTGQATLFGNGNTRVPATLRQLSDVTDPLTRTFEARYVLDGELAQAPLGATVTIRLADVPAAAPGSLEIPVGALIDNGKGPGVWVIDGEPARVTWRPVAVVRMDDEHAVIGGQIARGERIVSLGAHRLREGEPVRLAGDVGAQTESVQP